MRDLKALNLRTIDLDKVGSGLIFVCAFLFPVLVITVNRADTVFLLLLAIIGTLIFFIQGTKRLALSHHEFILILIFVGWYATIVLCYYVGDKTDIGFKLLGRDFRIFCFVPILIAFRKYLRTSRPVLLGMILAPYPIAALAFWQFLQTNQHTRASGFIDAIPFGDLSMAMAFMAPAFLIIIEHKRTIIEYAITCGALLAGVLSSVLSESRGGWIALPVLIWIMGSVFFKSSATRGAKLFIICGIILLSFGFLFSKIIIRDRVTSAIDNVERYYDFVRLVDKGDINHLGCLNDKYFLSTTAYALKKHYGEKFLISVVPINSKDSLISETGNDCESNMAIRLQNLDKSKVNYIAIQRKLINSMGHQEITFLMKGDGFFSINGVKRDWIKFSNEKFQYVTVINKIKKSKQAKPYIFVPGGGVVYFVPVQVTLGEYIFPFVDSSVGKRLEMWRAAWHIFNRHRIFGAGTGAFKIEVNKLIKIGDVSPSVFSYDHPHNDYLNSMSTQGIVGLIFYLLSMGYPLVLFVRAIRYVGLEQKAIGYAGTIMNSSLLIFGLTETMFSHSIVMSWYVIFTAMFVVLISKSNYEESTNV